MAINKKLIHFGKRTNFDTEVANGNILDTSVVFIKDTHEIYTHGDYYTCKDWADNIDDLQTLINTLVSGNASTAIESFNEIIAFLEGIEDSESLDSIIASIEQQIADINTTLANKADKSSVVTSVAGKTGAVTLTKSDVGLGSVDNTADANKSVKYATSAGSATSATKATQDASGNTITTTYATKTEVANKQDICLKFSNLSASTWVADTTYSDFGYRCDLACSGVTADMYAEVVFEVTQAASGSYAPVCETGSGIVSIWSSVQDTITVPVIIITK